MAWPAVKRKFSQEEIRVWLTTEVKWGAWRPSYIVLHNTAAPSWAQWDKTAQDDKKKGIVPGTTRVNSLDNYFRVERGWSGAPHFFVPDDGIWAFNPVWLPGVHSPSYNHNSIGIEMVADFAVEDDDSGPGLKVRNNTIYLAALLCEIFGLDPHHAVILHKDDPETTHDCPGKDFAQDRAAVIASIAALMIGGEHDPEATLKASGDVTPAPVKEQHGTTTASDLNFRRGPGVNNEQIGSLPRGTDLIVMDSAKNANDTWLRVKTPAGYLGWVSGRYVALK